MTKQHTPGPWFVNGPWHIQADTKKSVPDIVANILQPRNGDLSEREANARLIAAAPAMLQALRDVAQAYQDLFDCMPVAWQTFDHIVNTAIQEATGEQ